jgi:predicted nucleic acid-binding Zn ribbon protein
LHFFVFSYFRVFVVIFDFVGLNMRKGKKVEQINDILARMLKRLGIDKKLRETSVFTVWAEEVGKRIANSSAPAYIKRGRLTVYVESGTHIQEYNFLKKELIKKLNSRIGSDFVKEINFVVGDLGKKEEKPKKIKKK